MVKIYLTATVFIPLLVAALAFSSVASGQVDQFTSKPRRPVQERSERLFALSYEAAEKGRDDVVKLKPAKNDDEAYARALGFDSVQQASRAQLGGSLSIYASRLDWFKNAFPGDMDKLMIVTGQRIYTLHVNGEPKSSVTVAFDPLSNKWRAVEWGSRKLIRLFERERRRHPSISFVLLITPENPRGLRFVGEERAGRFFLTPLTNIDEIDLKAGEEVTADTFVTKIRALAVQLPKP